MEIWLPVVGFEGLYEVSDLGRVRSVDRLVARKGHPFQRKGMVLTPARDGDGYPKVALGRKNQRKVHRLVAEVFIPNPFGLPEVDHEDADKTNCRAANLRWCTKRQNTQHRHDKGYKTCEIVFGPEVRLAIQAAYLAGVPLLHISRDFGVSRAHARRIALSRP